MVLYCCKHKQERCPACGSEKVLDRVYGYPSPEMIIAEKAGEIALGGCIIREDSPNWQCGDCHMVLDKLD